MPSYYSRWRARLVDRRVLHLIKCGWNAPWKKPMIEEGRHHDQGPGHPARHPAGGHQRRASSAWLSKSMH